MSAKTRFKELGHAYLDQIEGALGCRIDAVYVGKEFELADLTATLKRFYGSWSPESEGLRSGEVVDWSDEPEVDDGSPPELHSAEKIEVPLRSQCRNDPGIFIIMGIRDDAQIRSLLMFADAILFWDPFEQAIDRSGSIDQGVAELGLAYLRPLRPLIEAGLVVPAQVARTAMGGDSIRANFAPNLMWQGALGNEEFEKRVRNINAEEYQLSVPEGPLAARGQLGHAENKVASLFLPDIVIPLMDYEDLSSYQKFCKNIDRGLKSRELDYFHKSLAFETGFIIDPDKLTNESLLDLRQRDVIFSTLRKTIIEAVANYEKAVAAGTSADFIQEFDIELKTAFQDLKSKALVSNTWKEFVDESKSFSSRLTTKIFTAPLHGKQMVGDWFESLNDTAPTSVANLLVASLKTYARYRNTKILMDMCGAIREHSEDKSVISV